MQSKYFFKYIVNINEHLKKTDEKKCCLSMFNRATYLDQTGNYVGKTCSQKVDLCIPFITHLKTFVHVWACAHAIAGLS